MKLRHPVNLDFVHQYSRITIVKLSEFGYPIVINLTLDGYEDLTGIEKYAQYDETLYFVGKLPRKRKLNGFRIKPNEDVYIYKGTIQEKDFKDFKETSIEENGTVITSFSRCFEDNALDDFVSYCKEEPILVYKGFKNV